MPDGFIPDDAVDPASLKLDAPVQGGFIPDEQVDPAALKLAPDNFISDEEAAKGSLTLASADPLAAQRQHMTAAEHAHSGAEANAAGDVEGFNAAQTAYIAKRALDDTQYQVLAKLALTGTPKEMLVARGMLAGKALKGAWDTVFSAAKGVGDMAGAAGAVVANTGALDFTGLDTFKGIKDVQAQRDAEATLQAAMESGFTDSAAAVRHSVRKGLEMAGDAGEAAGIKKPETVMNKFPSPEDPHPLKDAAKYLWQNLTEKDYKKDFMDDVAAATQHMQTISGGSDIAKETAKDQASLLSKLKADQPTYTGIPNKDAAEAMAPMFDPINVAFMGAGLLAGSAERAVARGAVSTLESSAEAALRDAERESVLAKPVAGGLKKTGSAVSRFADAIDNSKLTRGGAGAALATAAGANPVLAGMAALITAGTKPIGIAKATLGRAGSMLTRAGESTAGGENLIAQGLKAGENIAVAGAHGAAFAAPFALTADTPEEAGAALAGGAAFGAMAGAVGEAGARAFSPAEAARLDRNVQRPEAPKYGTPFDEASVANLANLSNMGAARFDVFRQIAEGSSKVPVEIYYLKNDELGALYRGLTGRDAPEVAGFVQEVKDASGNARKVIGISADEQGVAAGHEPGHVVWQDGLTEQQRAEFTAHVIKSLGLNGLREYRDQYNAMMNADRVGVPVDYLPPDPDGTWSSKIAEEYFSEQFAHHVNSLAIDLHGGLGRRGLLGDLASKAGGAVEENTNLIPTAGYTDLRTNLGWRPTLGARALIDRFLVDLQGQKDANGKIPPKLAQAVKGSVNPAGEAPSVTSTPENTAAAAPAGEIPGAKPVAEKPVQQGFKKGDPVGEVRSTDGTLLAEDAKVLRPAGEGYYEIEYTHPDTGARMTGTVPEAWLQSPVNVGGVNPDAQVFPASPVTPKTPAGAARTLKDIPAGEAKNYLHENGTPVTEEQAARARGEKPKTAEEIVAPRQVENVTRPAAANPPEIPVSSNVRTTEARQKGFEKRGTAEEQAHNEKVFAAAAANRGVGQPFEINHAGAESTVVAPDQVTRERQRLASEAEGTGALKKVWQKVFFPFKVSETSKGKTVFGLSLDKIIQNVDILAGWQKEHGGVDPYLKSPELVTDIQHYLDNQAHGYAGDGRSVKRPLDTRLGSVTAEDPTFKPTPVSRENAQKINALMGYNPAERVTEATAAASDYFKRFAELNQERVGKLANGLAEVNPYREQLRQQGFDLKLLNQATEQIRIADIVGKAKPRPDLNFKPGDTGLTKAGFMPVSPTIKSDLSKLTAPEKRELLDGAKWYLTNREDNAPLAKSLKSPADLLKLSDEQVVEAAKEISLPLASVEARADAFVPPEEYRRKFKSAAADEVQLAPKAGDKPLPHTIPEEELEMVHFSDVPGIKETDPKRMVANGTMAMGEHKTFFFTRDTAPSRAESRIKREAGDGYQYRATLSGRALYDMDRDPLKLWRPGNWAKMDQRLIDEGYAGYVAVSQRDGEPVPRHFAAIYYPVKVTPDAGIARGRAGRFNFMPAVKEPFYSQAERTLEAIPERASRAQIDAAIRDGVKHQGVLLQRPIKAEELRDIKDAAGQTLESFLKDNPNASRQDILDFVKQNRVQVTPAVYGDRNPADVREGLRQNYSDASSAYGEATRTLTQAAQDAGMSRLDAANAPGRLADGRVGWREFPPEMHIAARNYLIAKEAFFSARDALDAVRTQDSPPSATKYEQYVLPGGENYREEVLTLPGAPALTPAEVARRAELLGTTGTLSEAEVAELSALSRKRQLNEEGGGNRFTSSHFNTPGYLAHTRYNERTTAAGERVLHAEELQSDLHQKGRKEGYAETLTPERRAALQEQVKAEQRAYESATSVDALNAASSRWDALRNRLEGDGKGVPDAPFKKSWPELVFKHLLRRAAEAGADRLTWTTGEQQAERYDLSKQIDKIEWAKNEDGTYDILATPKGQSAAGTFKRGDQTLDQVSELVGKDLTQKIVESKYLSGELTGLDLKVGGEGMKGFYDNMLPSVADKVGKRWGVKSEDVRVRTGNERKGAQMVDDGAGGLVPAGAGGATAVAHSLPLTEAMRKDILDNGQALYMPSLVAQRHLEQFNGDSVKQAMRKPGWAILTATQEAVDGGNPHGPANVAANDVLQAELARRGLPFAVVGGSWAGNDQGRSFLVTGISEKSARALGKKYKQDSVLTNRGFVYSQDGSVQPLDHKATVVGPDALKETGYTTLPDGTPFSVKAGAKEAPDVRETPAYRAIAPHLTEGERTTMRRDTAEDVVKHFESFPSDEEFKAAALMGAAKKGWYSRAATSLANIFGPDTEKFVALLAATSPRQSVQKNLEMSAAVWDAWEQAGRPTDQAEVRKIVAEHVQLEAREDNSVRALAGALLDKPVKKGPAGSELSGFKVEHFRRNLLADQQAVTNDSWMAQLAGVSQQIFGTKAGYAAMSAKVRRVAKKLDMTPAEVQETTWSFFKTLVENTTVNNPAEAVLHALTEAHIAATPEFATELLANPNIQRFLAAQGLTPGDIVVPPANSPKAGALAGQLIASGLSTPGVLGRLAKRAQAIKDAELAGKPAADDGEPY